MRSRSAVSIAAISNTEDAHGVAIQFETDAITGFLFSSWRCFAALRLCEKMLISRKDAKPQSNAKNNPNPTGACQVSTGKASWIDKSSSTDSMTLRQSAMSEREHAHELIDRLPETELSALVGLLEAIVDPVQATLRNAPVDDELESEDEKQAVAESRDWLVRNDGKSIPHDEAMRRLGLGRWRIRQGVTTRPLP
uniref:Uncharacterized protein n=1 Tax=Solibacter usitatus (strain Ellin6076) TaxID=234267 RepID=Q01YS6_SOLUE